MNAWPETKFDEQVRVRFPSGKPAANYRYEIVRADGARVHGVTDGDGWAEVQKSAGIETHRIRLLGPAGGGP